VFCSNESTFVTDHLAHCLCCVLLANRCAFGARLDVGTLDPLTKHGFSEVPVRFLSRRGGKRASVIRRDRLTQHASLYVTNLST